MNGTVQSYAMEAPCDEFEGTGELGAVDILSRPKRPSVLAQQWERHCVEHSIFIVCDPTHQSPAAQDDQRGSRADAMQSSTDSSRFQPVGSTCTSPVCINSDHNSAKVPPIRVTSTPLFSTNGLVVSPNFSAESIYEAEFLEGSQDPSYTELSEQLAQQTENVRQLELRLSASEQQHASLSAENERLNIALDQAKKNEEDFSRLAVQSEQTAWEARRERDELQESLTRNENALADTRALMRELQDELVTVKLELQESEAKVQEMEEKLDEAHKQLMAADTLSETWRQEAETHKRTGEELSVQLEATRNELNELNRIKLDLSSELDHQFEECRRVSTVNDNLKRQLSIFASPTTKPCNIDSSDELSTDFAMISTEPASLGEEIQALKDRGALPIGVRTSDSENNSIINFVIHLMEERYNMAERQVRELAPRLELDPRAFEENENRRQFVINLIAGTQVEEEKLSELLQKLVASDVSEADGGDESHRHDESSCILVMKLVRMQNQLRRATESLSERMGGLELQLTQSVEPSTGDGAVAVPSITPGPGSSVADGSQQHGDGERACSEASWGRSTIGGGSGVNALHPVPLRDVSIEGSDAVSCAGSQLERDTCSHLTPERIKCHVQRELAALQSQINKSLEVLAALARSSDLLSVLKEYPISEQNQPDAVSATSGMEEHREGSATDGLHPTSGMAATGHQLAKSCPTLATQLSAATQTENEQIDIPTQRMVGSTGDVKEFDEPSPKRFRSSSFVAAIEAGDTPVVLEEPEDGEDELEDEVLQVEVTSHSAEFMDSVAEFDNSHELLDEFRLSRKLSVLHEEADENTTTMTESRTHELSHAPPPYRAPPNPYQSRSFESYLDPPIPGYRYSDPSSRLYYQGSIKRQASDPTPTGVPPPYRAPPAPGARLTLVAQVHREESGLQCGPRSTSRPLQLPPSPSPVPSPPLPTKVVHFDATSPQSPPYMTPPDASPWTSPRASACLDEAPPLISARASALRASLRRRSARVVEEHPCSGIDGAAPTLPASPEHPEEELQLSSSPPGSCNDEAVGSPELERHSTSQQNPRLSRQRGSLTGAISSAIQRSAAVDLDENEETTPAAQQAAVVVSPGGSKRGSVVAFPSIPDAVLRQMGLHRDSAASPESLTEHDVENKFTQLSLAFKTDKLTLDHRVNIQQRQRDDAERNVAREISELRNKINRLKRLCQESETIEELSEVQHQVDVLAQSTESVSRSAELYGAVQQEERVSRAVDVILAHVENLRRVQSKERTELEETRRLLQEAASDTGDDLTSGRGGVRLRTQQLQANARRRASIAALPRSASPAEHRSSSSLLLDSSRVRQPVRALQESSVRRTSFGSQSQRPESMGGSIDETVRVRRSDLTLEAQLMQTELEQSSEGSVSGTVPGANLDILHDEDVALAASLADHLGDLSCSEDELQHELNWRDSELRQRRSQSGQGVVLSQTSSRFPTARSLSTAVRSSWRYVRSLRWPWSTEQSVWMLRRGATGVLLALAALTMLFVLVPMSTAVATGSRICSWNPLRIEMPSGHGFQGYRRPPPI